MPIPNDYLPLINKLATASREGRVLWKQTPYGGFAVTVAGTNFEIWAGTAEDSDLGFVAFGLANPKEKRRSPIDTWSVDEGDDDFSRMRDLFGDARRQALGIANRLTSLEKALDGTGTIGEDSDDHIPF